MSWRPKTGTQRVFAAVRCPCALRAGGAFSSTSVMLVSEWLRPLATSVAPFVKCPAFRATFPSTLERSSCQCEWAAGGLSQATTAMADEQRPLPRGSVLILLFHALSQAVISAVVSAEQLDMQHSR
jgi:hypothetical protein